MQLAPCLMAMSQSWGSFRKLRTSWQAISNAHLEKMVPVLKTVSDHLHLMQAELYSCSINNPCRLYPKIGVFCETVFFSKKMHF